MTRVRVSSFTISLDGYGSGPDQDLGNPLGIGGEDLHQWLVATRTFQKTLYGRDGGTTGVDDDFAARGFENSGAWILGRNMFSPLRGPWPDTNWKGWWGDNPPYHVPVFVLTHHARPAIEMEGGTTFHFITGGIHQALERAREAAGAMDVRIGGGNFVMIAGPCSVESEEQIVGIAKAVKASGAQILRGGAFKPRTSPYDFQGLAATGLELLKIARQETGLPIVTEIIPTTGKPCALMYAFIPVDTMIKMVPTR